MIILSTTPDIQNRGCAVDLTWVSPGLQRNVLTPSAKRWQLWGKGVRGADAETIITELYGLQE